MPAKACSRSLVADAHPELGGGPGECVAIAGGPVSVECEPFQPHAEAMQKDRFLEFLVDRALVNDTSETL